MDITSLETHSSFKANAVCKLQLVKSSSIALLPSDLSFYPVRGWADIDSRPGNIILNATGKISYLLRA